MKKLKDFALTTPDPEHTFKSLQSFYKEHHATIDSCSDNELSHISQLFSYSQFLTNYCFKNPSVLWETLKKLDDPLNAVTITRELSAIHREMESNGETDKNNFVYDYLREGKKKFLLLITLRFILEKTDTFQSMIELSLVADALIDLAYRYAHEELTTKYGALHNDSFSIIALGKLGANELNYSSDIDIICVYGDGRGETSGILNHKGVKTNSIDNHLFYCKLVELITKLLSANTKNGFVYRVDLRLRPEGQKGELALSLSNYELYYESWGREWERLSLLRARHVAGDTELGNKFLDMIQPFVYRKYIDMNAIEEIRKVKAKIDASSRKNDIKRGYGGIREIEFFTQALQIIYGGKEPFLKERSLLIALHKLLQKNLIGHDDYSSLFNNYLYLRKLEQMIQMLNDIQTHKMPEDEEALTVLSVKMGYRDKKSFINDVNRRRLSVQSIFNSLFKPSGIKIENESNDILYMNMNGEKVKEFLLYNYDCKSSDPDKIVYYLKKIKEGLNSFQTLRGKRQKDIILPQFTEKALQSRDMMTALKNVVRFCDILETNEPYLELFISQKELIGTFVEIFSLSEYLSTIMIANPLYLDMISGGTPVKKTLNSMISELTYNTEGKFTIGETLTVYRKMEEVRLGIMFLNKKISVSDLTKGLTKTSEAVLNCLTKTLSPENSLLIAGYGKLGGREITINSDLDLVFVCDNPTQSRDLKIAEKIMRGLMSYTREGITYKVDTRLRPEGSKGPLLNTLEGMKKYYLNKARTWEIQALLKARPITGNRELRIGFLHMVRDVVAVRSEEILSSHILEMRERIKKELLNPSALFDVKLGDGGIEDIEFLVQYLQLKNITACPSLLLQNTVSALRRLIKHELLNKDTGSKLISNYLFFRNLETVLRLRGENIILENENFISSLSLYFNYNEPAHFLSTIKALMDETIRIVDKLM